MTTEQKNRIVFLRQAGYGYTAVARELGMTKSAICKYCLFLALLLIPVLASAGRSGTCGSGGPARTLDDTGTLTIRESGSVPDYEKDNAYNRTKAPWGADITKVYIEEGVTGIGCWAFCGCTQLTEANIPTTVKSINQLAFEYAICSCQDDQRSSLPPDTLLPEPMISPPF